MLLLFCYLFSWRAQVGTAIGKPQDWTATSSTAASSTAASPIGKPQDWTATSAPAASSTALPSQRQAICVNMFKHYVNMFQLFPPTPVRPKPSMPPVRRANVAPAPRTPPVPPVRLQPPLQPKGPPPMRLLPPRQPKGPPPVRLLPPKQPAAPPPQEVLQKYFEEQLQEDIEAMAAEEANIADKQREEKLVQDSSFFFRPAC